MRINYSGRTRARTSTSSSPVRYKATAYKGGARRYRGGTTKTGSIRVTPAGAIQIAGGLYNAYRRYKKKNPGLTRKIAVGNGSTKSSYTCGSSRQPKDVWSMFQQNQKFTYSTVGAQRLTSNVYGAQVCDYAVFAPSSLWTSDLGRAIGGSPTNAQVSTSTLCYGTMKVTTTYTNVELTTSYLHIYEMEPRFHLASSLNQDPIGLWNLGLNYECDTSGVVYSSNIYSSPFKSHRFVDYMKVKKIFSIELPAGGSHTHISYYNLNRKLRGSIPLSHGAIRDFTKFQMYIASGTPLNDSLANVSTSTIAIDVVTRREHEFTYDATYREKALFESGLSTITGSVNVISDATKQADTNA